MSRIFRHTLIRRRAPLVENRHGNSVRDWAAAQDVPLPGWAVDAGDTRESNEGREGTVVAYTARRRGARADLAASDRVVLFGEEYSVDGAVLWQPGATARTSHSIVALIRAEG